MIDTLVQLYHYSNEDISLRVSVDRRKDVYKFELTYSDVPGTDVFWLNRHAALTLIVALDSDLKKE